MINNDYLSAWDVKSDADILDSTEYLRNILRSSLIVQDTESENDFTSLRFTQDLTQELEALAPGIDQVSWIIHEPEMLGQFYKSQINQGANVAVAQTECCGLTDDDYSLRLAANKNALLEAENNEAAFYIGNLDVSVFTSLDYDDKDAVRKAKMLLVKQLDVFSNEGAHGVWVRISSPDMLPTVLESLRLHPELPAVLAFNVRCIQAIDQTILAGQGLCVRVESLGDLEVLLPDVLHVQHSTNTRLVLEISKLGMSEQNAMEFIGKLKSLGIMNFRPGSDMSRQDRVVLYSFI